MVDKMLDLFAGKMTDPKDILNFIFAGQAKFTVVSLKTNARFTYKIQKRKGQHHNGRPLMYVHVLRGADNNRDYGYLGYIRPNGRPEILPGKKGQPEATSYRAIKWLLSNLNQKHLPDNVEFYHSGECGRCGRTLTVPESIQTGLGPVCAGKTHDH